MPTINRRQCKRKFIRKASDASIYYNSIHWKKLRNIYIKTHPLCASCAAEGRSVPAEEVHHRTPFLTGNTEEERWRLLLDPDNLMSLCIKCHHKIHMYMNRKSGDD